MRTAICFNGLVGTTDGKSSELKGDPHKCFEISSPLYKKHIIDVNNVDVFVHSWSTDLEKEIVDAYHPKKYLIEPQKVFNIPKYIKGKNETRKQTHYSLWYTRQASVQLKNEYEQENNFKYDCVMLARFDLAWQSDLIFEDYDQQYFWVGKWPKKIKKGRMLKDVDYWKLSNGGKNNDKLETKWWGYPHNRERGILGMWFFSNGNNIDKFVTLFNCLDEYSLPNKCPTDHDGKLSAHLQCVYHLEQLGMINKLKFCDKNWHDDFPSVRRKYYQTR